MLPPNAPPALARALELHQAGQREAALGHYDEAVRAQPALAFSHYARGLLLHELGRNDDALEALVEACRLDPAQPGWQADSGAIAFAAGRHQQATEFFQRAVQGDPSRWDVWGQLGDLLRESGELAAAQTAYEQAVRLAPGFVAAWLNLSLTARRVGNPGLALDAAQRALALQPDAAPAHEALGHALLSAGQAGRAVESFKQALSRAPADAGILVSLAQALIGAGRPAEAESLLTGLLARAPDNVAARLTWADLLRDQGRVEAAANEYHDVLVREPGNLSAWWNLGNLAWQAGHHREAASRYRQALSCKPDDAALHSNLLYALLYDFSLRPETLLAAHREYSERHEAALRAAWPAHQNLRDSSRPLRIGYVSADFRLHPVAHFLLPILKAHDRRQFEVTAYANQAAGDAMTDAIRRAVAHWVPCADLDDAALAARIREDRIDILIDLSGHTAGNRLPALARKPAPVQMTYLSYPGTTGLSAIDYRITDGLADGPGAEAAYSEQLLRLPDSLCCYQPADYMPEPGPLPAAANGVVTFASFNNYNKLTDDCLALWGRLLQAVPGSRLLMAAMPEGPARAEALQRLARHGIDSARVELLGKRPGPEFVRAMRRADIALDPFPLTGGTTTMECLWMGLPTVVLEGDRFISRVGASFLRTAGLHAFLARDADEYVAIAAALAEDRTALAHWRASLRDRLLASPLLDSQRFVRGLEAGLRTAWKRWCAGLQPVPISESDAR